MVATSGDKLIVNDAISSLKAFLPKASLITPNIPEAELLINRAIELSNLDNVAREIGKLYGTSVLLKGGHLDALQNEITDTLYIYENDAIITLKNPWIDTKNTHGTGCSLSSSIAAFLSLGPDLEDAVKKGCHYINRAIAQGENKVLGKGHGPINHFGLK